MTFSLLFPPSLFQTDVVVVVGKKERTPFLSLPRFGQPLIHLSASTAHMKGSDYSAGLSINLPSLSFRH